MVGSSSTSRRRPGSTANWAPLREAPLTRAVAVRSRTLPLRHEDPADRFLAATAAVYDLKLVTADERLWKIEGYQVLPSR